MKDNALTEGLKNFFTLRSWLSERTFTPLDKESKFSLFHTYT